MRNLLFCIGLTVVLCSGWLPARGADTGATNAVLTAAAGAPVAERSVQERLAGIEAYREKGYHTEGQL